jgi:hypothetical protein
LRRRHVKLAAESGAIEKLMITVLEGGSQGYSRGTRGGTRGYSKGYSKGYSRVLAGVLAGVLTRGVLTRRGTHSKGYSLEYGRLLWQDTMFRNRDLAMRAAYVALVETVKASRGEVRAQCP